MSIEAYPNRTTFIADKYYLKNGVAVKTMDVMALTGNTVNGRLEVDKMSGSYTKDKVVGVTPNSLDAAYIDRAITIGVKGPMVVKLAKAVVANQALQGSSGTITETFSGDNTAQQAVVVEAVPIATVTSFKEDNPTTLTRITDGTAPSTNEYSLDDTTGALIIGGTSVSGTDNYTLIFTIDSGRLEPFEEFVEEVLTAAANVITLSHEPDFIEFVDRTTGTATGGTTLIIGGTVATGEGLLDRTAKTITFYATDAVLTATIRYKPKNYRHCARALESKAAGEQCNVYFEGVEAA